MDYKERYNELKDKREKVDFLIRQKMNLIEATTKEVRSLKDDSLILDGALEILKTIIDEGSNKNEEA